MTEAPLVTVVVPTWNRKALIGETIASVIAQTYSNWELVVADDGSSDGTVEALRAIAEPRLRIVALEHGGNISRVRNAGAAAGGGDLVAFLDSDDVWLPRKLQLQVAALRDGSARWCYTDHAHIAADGTRIPRRAGAFRPDNGRIVRSLLLDETAAYIGTVIVERRLFEAIGAFDESLEWRADFDFALRVAAAADAVALPDVTALVREHAGRITASVQDPHQASARVFEKFLERETEADLCRIARARRSALLADAGFLSLSRRDFARGARLLAAAAVGGGLGHIHRRGLAWLTKRRGRHEAPRNTA